MKGCNLDRHKQLNIDRIKNNRSDEVRSCRTYIYVDYVWEQPRTTSLLTTG